MADQHTVLAAELFKRAIDQPTEERSAFLDEACGDDVDLRREVESLLQFNEDGDRFLEQPAIEIAFKSFLSGALKPDQRIGNYKVVSHIGSGGMGEVYLAHDEKLNRQVALKLVRFGIGAEETSRHFCREAQILASLNHPNIAQLYDAEITPEGFSFLVMEYVEGLRIDKYCADHHLSINDRLETFQRVCGAVHYAHQRLAIHRDIKPANILVTKEGEPKLLDFGIAKLLDTEASTAREPTLTFAAAMTPEYASPEQVRGETMTTASDVYSLGVILYELLTGQRPYRIKTRTAAEIARAVTDQEPARPSTAVARGDRSSKSQVPSPKMLRGDLDNIVLKAMRKEPQRRYTSVEQFSDDIHRYLEDRPVSARTGTLTYRAVKFVGRNKVAVTAAALVVLAVLTGLIVAVWQAENARTQRDVAQHQRLKAERINSFLQRMLSFSNQSITSVWPVAERRDVTVNDMLDQITPKVEAELSDEPDVRAQVQRTLGNAYASEGRYDLAEKNLRGALNAQIQLYGEDSLEAADTMSELGVLCYRQLRYDKSSGLLEKAVAAYRKQRRAKAPGYNAAKFALALKYLGVIKAYQVDPYAGRPLLAEALQISLSANLKGDERGVLAFNKTDAGANMVYTGEVEKGEALLREALAEYRQISGRPRWEQGSTLTHLGAAAMIKRQFDEAQKFLQEGEQIFRETLGDKSTYLIANLSRQATALLEKNDLKAAEGKAREGLAMAHDFSPERSLCWGMPTVVLGKILIKSGRTREGEDYLRQALAILDEQTTKNYFDIGNLKIDLSQFLLAENRLAEAEQIAVEAREDVLRNLGAHHPLMKSAKKNLIAIYDTESKHDLAEALK
jgi:tRNA A-37 threonylcarbamoyl transferase component Bud32/tetratricopeptide (TPR) repeat protein